MQNFKMVVTPDQSKIVQEICKPESKPTKLSCSHLCYLNNSFSWPTKDWWNMNHGEYLPELTYYQFLDKYGRLSTPEEIRKETSKPWVILASPNNSDHIRLYIMAKGFKFGQAGYHFGHFFSEDGKSLGNDYRYVENAGYRIIQTSELNKIIKDMNKTNQSDTFTLPKNWHVVVTEENQKEVSEWFCGERKDKDYLVSIDKIVGWDGNDRGMNPAGAIKGNTYDFGQEITTEQFRKYVLKKEVVEEKTFPRMMLVWDYERDLTRREVEVHGYIPTLQHPWIGEGDRWRHAKEIPAPQFICLTAQDISEGKGVGIDPKLIKFKE